MTWWRKEAPDDAPPDSFAQLAQASMSRDGYRREAAVRRLAGIDDGRELPYLLQRLNDWVDPVALAASRAVRARLTPGYARHFHEHLHTVIELHGARRRDLMPLVGAILGLLPRGRVEAIMSAFPPPVRRAVAAQIYAEPHELEALLRRAAVDRALLGPALTRLAAVDDEEMLRFALALFADTRDRLARRTLLRIRVQRLGDTAAIERALLDRDGGLRALAQHWFAGDAAAFYRDRLHEATPEAIAGLGDRGARDDARLLLPFLRDARAGIRTAAVKAIGRLDADGRSQALLPLLADEAPMVSRATVQTLQRAGGSLTWREVAAVLGQAAPLPAFVNAVRVATAMTTWDALLVLLTVHQRVDAADALRRWASRRTRGSRPPSSAQRDALEAFGSLMPREIAELVRANGG
jgi:HEAT repeat protein